MHSQLSVLYPSMKIVYVLSDRHQYTFRINICLTSAEKLPERSVFFPQSEGSLGLNAPIDSQHDPFFVLFTLRSLNFEAISTMCANEQYKNRIQLVATAKEPTLRLKLASGVDSLRQAKTFIDYFQKMAMI
jgi:hypothetical protein